MKYRYIVVERKTYDFDDVSFLKPINDIDPHFIMHSTTYQKTKNPKYHLKKHDIDLISKILRKDILKNGMSIEYLDIIHSYLKIIFGRDKIINLSSTRYKTIIFLFVDVRLKNF